MSEFSNLHAHEQYMRLALDVAKNCRDVGFYGVGCVIINSEGKVIADGYTGEIKEAGQHGVVDFHAEEVALIKLRKDAHQPASLTMYVTLEPCSERKSKPNSCSALTVQSGIKKVVFGAREPFDERLKIVCKGSQILTDAGVELVHLVSMQEECLASVLRSRRKY